jgi:hypothetical protein
LFNKKENISNKKTTITNSDTDYPTTKAVINAMWPVGSIYMSVNNTNPGTYLPGTSWTAWGSGRVPVGVDASQTEFNTVEKTDGEKTHTLQLSEIPSHSHSITCQSGLSTDCGGSSRAAADDSWTSKNTENTGGGQAHNNLQPYITCYMFKRTA